VEQYTSIIYLIVLAGLFYFLLIRPQRAKEKAAVNLRNSLVVGDEVVTIGGIVGKIVSVKDDMIVLQTSTDKTPVKMMKWSIHSKLNETDNTVKQKNAAIEETAKKKPDEDIFDAKNTADNPQ
jgi:preprotein translocase subunit YajC